MFTLLIYAFLEITTVDDFCRSHFGHPGDLGVTEAAEVYFRGGATYAEIVATIGRFGEEVRSNDPSLQVVSFPRTAVGCFSGGLRGRGQFAEGSGSAASSAFHTSGRNCVSSPAGVEPILARRPVR